ncbi:MAG: sugar ABC transporter permease [Ruminococcaceae bacterium]|nr:sugar ABC transporter permease [Oscillospiraceae bacterium]
MKKTNNKFSFREQGTLLKKDLYANREVYFLLIPVVVFYIIFCYMPMYGALIAFKDYAPKLGVTGSPWVGFKHFEMFFNSPSFLTILWNTVRISLYSLLVEFPAPIILAMLINELRNARFAKVVQTATYLPHFISLIVVCGMIKDFTRDTGIITQLLSLFGVPEVSLLGYPQYFLPIYIGSNIWQDVGWSSIIYLAALTGVDPQLYEAAKIDGANKWQQTIHVTLVGIMPTIITMLILRMGSILSVGYEKIILLYNDATLEVADVISSYVYRKGILEQSWSFSTAVNLFNSVVNLVFLLITNKISSKVNETSLW